MKRVLLAHELMAGLERGPGGRWLCRCGCRQECQGRCSWVSKAHVEDYLIRKGDNRTIRAALKKRDHGVCALCGQQVKTWDADHTVPLAEGGHHGLDNLRTLCRACHAGETGRLAGRLAAGRRVKRRSGGD